MNDSEDSQGIEEVEHVQDNDKGVHLVLLHVSVGPVNHINILLFRFSIVNIIENSIYVSIVGHLWVIELHDEEDDDEKISGNWQFITISFSIQFFLSFFQLLHAEVLGNHQL